MFKENTGNYERFKLLSKLTILNRFKSLQSSPEIFILLLNTYRCVDNDTRKIKTYKYILASGARYSSSAC